jgi:uncharacterized protein (TIGR03492 family)
MRANRGARDQTARPALLVVTNGAGEEWAAASVLEAVLRDRPATFVRAAALASDGSRFARLRVPVIFQSPPPSSGGFPLTSPGALLGDLTFLPTCLRFVRALARTSAPVGIFAIGDVFLLVLTRLAVRCPTVFLALAKSELGQRHIWPEPLLMRRLAQLVLTRDEATRGALRRCGVRAEYLGNPMMDLPRHEPLRLAAPSAHSVLLLPGSRSEWSANLRLLLDVALALPVHFECLCALPPDADRSVLIGALAGAGWRYEGSYAIRGDRRVSMGRDEFASLAARSAVVVGLAGTANEQAAGLGKPVVTFVGCGAQTARRRLRAQERLLGGAVRLVDCAPRAVAAEVLRLLEDSTERQQRGEAGSQRMGPPGGSVRIAACLASEFGLGGAPS